MPVSTLDVCLMLDVLTVSAFFLTLMKEIFPNYIMLHNIAKWGHNDHHLRTLQLYDDRRPINQMTRIVLLWKAQTSLTL